MATASSAFDAGSPGLSAASGSRFNLLGYTDALAVAAAVAGPLLLYAFTMPRTVVLEDDGWFLLIGKFLGVGHQPGFPIHTLISNLFLKLPFGSTPFLGHMLSAIFGALACGAVYICARLLGAAAAFALIGAWLFAVSEHFWAQAIITEVYTLNALFFFSIFALLLYLRRSPGDVRAWIAAAFLYGLSLANHLPLMLLATPGLVLAVFPVWRDLLVRWPRLAGAFLLGVVPPYAWMVWRSLQEPMFSFSGPLRTLDDIVGHLSRRAFSSNVDTSVSAGWFDKFEFVHWLGGEFVWQLTLPGFLLALLGLVMLLERAPWRLPRPVRMDDLLDWVGRCAGPVAFAGQSLVLLWLLDFDFDFFHVLVFRPYSVVCYGLLGIWLALGLQYASSLAGHRVTWPIFRRPGLVLGIASAAGLAMVGWSVSSHWDANNRVGTDFARRYADMVFDVLPPDAVLLTTGDEIILPLAYYHHLEGRRPDIRLANESGFLLPGNLYPSWLLVTPEMQNEALRDFIGRTDRPFFQVDLSRERHGRPLREYGFLREVLNTEYTGTLQIAAHPAAEEYFTGLFEREYRHGWEYASQNHRIHEYARYLGLAFISGNPVLVEHTAPLRELATQNYYGLNGMASALIRPGNAAHLDLAMEWLEKAESLDSVPTSKGAEAVLYSNMGRVRWHQGRQNEAIPLFEKSFEIWPHPDNPATTFLEQSNR